jgi:pimeloyl-ACP methyl ester carboxylesterase
MPVAITGSTSIDYDITGEGPPLLLVGGLGFGRWEWFKQVPAFSRHFRTITFDVRGERRLDNGVGDLAGEVVSLLDHLGVKKGKRYAEDRPTGVWRWIPSLFLALRRRVENMKAGVYKSISAGGRTSR